jgi:hemerythrin-like domain-containing protein
VTDSGPCPALEGESEVPLPADPKLAAEGWVRRHVAEATRAREWIDLYRSLGYEVTTRKLTESDFAAICGQCALAAGGSCVLIYTRNTDNEREHAVNATRCLRDEHQVILTVLECFEVALQQARESGKVSREVFEPFVEFFRGFADKCHHCKEEDRLFPCLERNGVPREGGPIGVMIHEHQQARLHVRTIAEHLDDAEAGDPEATDAVFEQSRAFLHLLRAHIEKEDHCLFGMADGLIHGAELTSLTGAYRSAESEPEYRATFSRCRELAERLAEAYGRSVLE